MTTKLASLSIFFPFFNERGTVERQIAHAYSVGSEVTDDLEVIALHGGPSTDGTLEKIRELKVSYPTLVVVDKADNTEGYAVIKYAIRACTKDWIFYTDGDAQYHLEEDLPLLVAEQQATGADVVNGYKKQRGDNVLRIFLGGVYARLARWCFGLPLRDVDCDFRLMRKKCLDRFTLESTSSSILPELIKKLELSGATFAEVPVNHYERVYGKSSYTPLGLLTEKLFGDIALFFKMRKVKRTLGVRNISPLDSLKAHIVRTLMRPGISILLRKLLEGNFRKQKKVIRERLHFVSPEKVLDLGCGTGEFSPLFERQAYVGIDIDPLNVAYAKGHYPGKTFLIGDALAIPFPDNSFEGVLVVGVLHHLTDSECTRVLSEIWRVLKRGGTLLLMEDTRTGTLASRFLRALDQGSHIRTLTEWQRLLLSKFSAKDSWVFTTGIGCPYSAFVFTNEKN